MKATVKAPSFFSKISKKVLKNSIKDKEDTMKKKKQKNGAYKTFKKPYKPHPSKYLKQASFI